MKIGGLPVVELPCDLWSHMHKRRWPQLKPRYEELEAAMSGKGSMVKIA